MLFTLLKSKKQQLYGEWLLVHRLLFEVFLNVKELFMYITETENNNLRSRADEINVGDTVTGCISASNDIDCFKVLFPINAIVNFELDTPVGTDYRIRVYKNDNYDTNVEAEDIRLGSYGEMRTCSCTVTPGDIYYVCISPNTSNLYSSSSNYTLRVFYEDTIITLPTDRTFTWNQFYTDVTDELGGSTAGCAWTCGLDVANIYGPSAYEPSDMPNSAWTTDGYTFALPNGCAGAFASSYTSGTSTEHLLSMIRTEIDNNRPVVLELYNGDSTTNGGYTSHYVVAYGYMGSGANKSQILVLDPAVGRNATSQKEGKICTLPQAESFSYNKTLRRLRKTSGR